jgi:biotin synthase
MHERPFRAARTSDAGKPRAARIIASVTEAKVTIARSPAARGVDAPGVDAIEALFALPFSDLLLRAQQVHRAHHPPNGVQLSTLLSIKTGGCPEDCGYCPQAARYHTGVANEALLDVASVVAAARAAQSAGASRFCMGAAWRGPKDRDLAQVAEMVAAVKALGLETCCTLGMLKDGQAEQLKRAGLDYYNHNLDTAPEFYGDIVSTRDYEDRLETLARVRDAGLRVCCGGIVGMGESRRHRAGLIAQLASLSPQPESVPINHLVQVEGTPLHARLHGEAALDPLEFVRTIAVARIAMPRAMIRLSAGRRELGEAVQALCYFAGANSIFYGERLLTTGNPDIAADRALFDKLGLVPMANETEAAEPDLAA